MSEAYSIQAKLTLDTSKFASEINKITKNIKNLSNVFSSTLGGEFEKTAKNIKTSSKALNSALSEEFKKSTKDIANVSKICSNVISEDFKKATKNSAVASKTFCAFSSSEFKNLTRKSVHQFKNLENKYGLSLANMTRSTRKRISEMNAQMTKAANPLIQMAAKGAAVAGIFTIMRKGAERFNIIKSFPAQMAAFGINAEIADKEVKKLSGNIVGLPVSLSDAVDQTKKLYMATFDLDKSTAIVTALNASYASSGAGANECYYATKHFAEALQSGKISGEDFDLILRGMGPAMLTVADKFGYGKDKLKDFRSSLISGEISMSDFSNKLIEAKSELIEMGKTGASSLNTVITNLNNAFGALGQEVISIMDKMAIAITGENLQTNIANITEKIKGFTKSLKDNLKEEDIKNIFVGLKDAFENIKGAIKNIKEGILGFKNFLNSLGFSDAQLVQFALQLSLVMIGMKMAFKTIIPIISTVTKSFSAIKLVLSVITAVASSAAAPFIAIGLVIAAVVAIVIWHWSEICVAFEIAKNTICAIATAIGNSLGAIWNWICSSAKWLWDSIVNTIVGFWNNLVTNASQIFGDIKNTIVGIFNSISSKVAEIWDGIKATIKRVWSSIAGIFEKVTGFFGGGGAQPKAAAISLDQNTFSAQEFLYEHNINHKIDSLLQSSNFSYDTNVRVNAPATQVYVLLDSKELAAKSFSSINDLINAKTLIKTTQRNGAW